MENDEIETEDIIEKGCDEVDIKIFKSAGEKKSKIPLFQQKPTENKVSILTDNEYYDTTNEKRGIALIFNQLNFTSMKSRSGTGKDRDYIAKVLRNLEFDVRIYNDLRKKELLNVLVETSTEDHSENDCFLVVVMSHGETGTIHAYDEQYPVEFLWRYFVGEKCKSLIGKPKLFFIQACRGEKLDAGVAVRSRHASMDYVDSKTNPIIYTIPSMADLLVMYSTYEGHYSWRNPQEGSWFIQAMSKEFEENASWKDLLTILTGIARRVAYSYQSNVPRNSKMDAMKQMPSFTSMLTKILYFTKKQRNTSDD